MHNNMKKYHWLIMVSIVLAILAPIMVNCLIQQDAWFVFVGKDTDWLVFWGNYLGGVITALVSMVILFVTLKHNHKENQNQQKYQEYRALENKLYDYIDTIKVEKLTIWLTAYQGKNIDIDDYSALLVNLTEYYNELAHKKGTCHLLEDETSQPSKEFIKIYNEIAQELLLWIITQICLLNRLLKNVDNDEKCESIKTKIEVTIFPALKSDTYYEPLIRKAKEWLKSEKENLR